MQKEEIKVLLLALIRQFSVENPHSEIYLAGIESRLSELLIKKAVEPLSTLNELQIVA